MIRTHRPSAVGALRHLACTGLALGAFGPAPAAAVNFLVYNNLDQVDVAPGNGTCDADPSPGGVTCTLRAAVMEANALAGPDLIRVNPGTYNLVLPETGSASGGDLDISDPVTIENATATLPIFDGQDDFTIFEVLSGDSLTLRGVVLRNGFTTSSGGCVRALGDLTVERAEMYDCVAIRGGAIAVSSADLTVTDSWIHDNEGGPTAGESNGTGGGIHHFSVAGHLALLERVTLEGNLASCGGALSLEAEAVLVNVTIRGNHATVCAGGVRATHSGRMSNVTLVNNVCDVGAAGGFFSFDANAWQVENSVIAQNSCGTPPVVQDCDGAFISGGYNLVGIGTDCVGFDETGDVVGPGPGSLDPILESLDNNGGWTPTHLPGPGSPLIQGGDPSGCFVDRDGSGAGAETLLLQDQRGAARPANGRCERGAVELGPIFFDGFESGSTVRWADTVP